MVVVGMLLQVDIASVLFGRCHCGGAWCRVDLEPGGEVVRHQ